ncbi:MAG: di-trans,poly-cis-decaprenylcistransferase [Actinobacteria bacterium]|nr:di-trans,poly-cis-decaprenylcistransferase [Actinomycetota bacterium]
MPVDPEFRSRLAGLELPRHLAVIPDGNRRWATERDMDAMDGHRAGYEVARTLSRFCREIGIHTVTIWAFSTENWHRSKEEVGALMRLYGQWIEELLPEAIEEQVRVVHLGRKAGWPVGIERSSIPSGFGDGLPSQLVQAIEEIEEKTRYFDSNVINLAINYGGADEIDRAIKKMHSHSLETGAPINELDVVNFLDTSGQPHPEPDLVWRTSGEFRSSGFLPVQSSYSELVFTPKYFPQLQETDVVEAVEEYSARARRFGR